MNKFGFLMLVILFSGFQFLDAQSNFDRVLNIFEQNGCATSACHGSGAAGLWLTGTDAEIYANLIEVPSNNPVSAARGYKIVDVGDPDNSTLYRKCGDGLYPSGALVDGEGATMPIGSDPMSDLEKEVIRQWILFGAPETGKNFSDSYFAAMEEYHTEGGISVVEQPEPPADGEGFQIYFGPIFLQPGAETEYSKKHQLDFDQDFEVNRIQNFMSDFSHHYIIYKWNGSGAGVKEGLRHISEDQALPTNQSFVSLWQENRNYQLPEGTAYFWEQDVSLDLNYHVKNYSTTSVMAADCYVNVYTQEKGTAEKEMKSDLIINLQIGIPANGQPDVEVGNFSTGQDWNVWMLTSHTHSLGRDFDVYLQNDDGSKGMQLYEGQHDTDYTFFTGSFDYAHPPVRYFDNFMKWVGGQSLIHEATYVNEGDNWVGFGVTTDDEMMITGVQYTLGDSHQNDPVVHNLPLQICEDASPVEILENYVSGAMGDGVYGNTFDPAKAGIGAHEIIVACCDEDVMQTFTIEVVALPEMPLINPSINGLATTPGFFSYQWYRNGEPILNANGLSLATDQSGSYAVEVSNNYGCTTVSDSYDFVGSGIEDFIKENAWSIAPNPTQGSTQLELQLEQAQQIEISVFNILGSEVATIFKGELASGKNSIQISLDNEPKGIYFLKMEIGDEAIVERIVKN